MDIIRLDPAALDARASQLCALLIDCVRNGSSVGFLASLDVAEAAAYWRGVHAAMCEGARLLFVAEEDGVVLGTVQLDLCLRANGVNRAEIQKLIVHSQARRRGIAALLMDAVERESRAHERGLLYLDTEAGSGAEAFYKTQGFHCIGGLPEYACSPDGVWRANAIYYKSLFLRAGA